MTAKIKKLVKIKKNKFKGSVGWDKMQKLRGELNAKYFEREDVVDGLLCCLLSRKHALLIGSPGTAKSMLVEDLCRVITGGAFFQRLLTKYSVPEELFGPVSMQGMKKDEFRRITTKKFPECTVAFLDEIFKANSAILNSLLTILNERKFDNNSHRVDCPLEVCVGASNEFPQGEELGALYDRFLVRFVVKPIKQDAAFHKLLLEPRPPITTTLTTRELQALQVEVDSIRLGENTVENIVELKHKLEEEGVRLSDRRWCEAVCLLKAWAFLAGRQHVRRPDLEIFKNVLWEDPSVRDKVASIVIEFCNPLRKQALEFGDVVEDVWSRVKGTNEASTLLEGREKLQNIYTEIQTAIASAGTDAETHDLETLAKNVAIYAKDAGSRFLNIGSGGIAEVSSVKKIPTSADEVDRDQYSCFGEWGADCSKHCEISDLCKKQGRLKT